MTDLPTAMERAITHFTAPPRIGKPASELTDRDRVAIAIAAGVEFSTSVSNNRLTVSLNQPIAIQDRGDGGYIVAIGIRARGTE